jgi:hypothetical protein
MRDFCPSFHPSIRLSGRYNRFVPIRLLFIALLALMLATGCRPADPRAATTAASAGNDAPVQDAAPFPIVILDGAPADIGRVHGEVLGGQLQELRDRFLLPWFGDDESRRQMAILTASMFASHVEPAHRAELEALSKASGVDLRELMLAQALPDLSPMFACSTITLPASAAPDGVARFGRNLDFPTLGIADKHSVLLIYRPERGYQFAAVAWPGMIGVMSGMNEHGLAIANMEVPRQPRAPMAMPCGLLYRTILEKCRTVDEALALLRNTPRQSQNNLMLMDAAGHRAVAEIDIDQVTIRRADEDEALISTNHHRASGAAPKCWRYTRLDQESAAQFGDIGVEEIRQMLAHVIQGNMTMQSMVFEPSNQVLWLAVGNRSAEKQLHRIDLRPYWTRP